MEYISVAKFRSESKFWLDNLPVVLTLHGKPVAKVTAIEFRIENKVWPTCEMGRLNVKLACMNDSIGKYRATLTTEDDIKHWELNLCPDHVKLIEKKDTMGLEKI
jgi:antitoxin (DNA-binding transcriptional repressor) of toxin-antitoxin stability system